MDESMDAVYGTSRPRRSPVASMSTDQVPQRHRLEWWARLAAQEIVPTALKTEHVDDFHGRAYTVDLAGVRLAEIVMSPMTGRRTPAHISRYDPESYQLFVVQDGPLRLEQRRHDSALDAGDIGLLNSSHPSVVDWPEQGRPAQVMILSMSREALPLPSDEVDRLLASRLPARTGSGAVLARYLTGLREHATGCDPAELSRLGAIGVDLAATFLAGFLGAGSALPAESRNQALVARIDGFIDRHLGDPELGPVGIAAHHHISVRTLHVLFERRPETVSVTIRRRRLERCRAELADPRLRERPIGEVGLRWGFRNAAEFSRAFRAAYGMSPTDQRRQAFTEGGIEPG
ncbi:AraC-like ligand-binding domain-containing protein [Nonomuraea endophytica]|uniref:AraC-like ligand-binding domain-containing protein n=1 Tax=Nonomuraea endophytica TaxID=714136 RepID=UPI0037C75C40